MKVRLNLATKALETHRRFLAGSGIVATVAGIVFLWLGWQVYSARKADAEVRRRTAEIREKMDRLEVQRQELEAYFAQKDIASLHERASFLNSIIDARSFNWTRMFMDLEHVLPGGVHVLSIEPEQKEGHVKLKLTVGASSDEAKVKLIRALEDSSEFSEVREVAEHNPPNSSTQSLDVKIVELTTVYSRS